MSWDSATNMQALAVSAAITQIQNSLKAIDGTSGTPPNTIIANTVIKIPNGTVAAPSLAFTTDLDNGIYLVGANNLGIAAAGVLQMSISSSVISLYLAQENINGTVSAPSMRWTSDPDTGFYKSSPGQIDMAIDGVQKYLWNALQFVPLGAGVISTGNATDYWNDISYKTLTDRGCLGCFDEGVELGDGRRVSDVEAIKAIQKHKTKKTVYGMPMLDYKTFPKVSYKKAEINKKELERDEFDEPIGGDDGIEMTSVFSIMLGAIKELANRIEKLEVKIGN